MTGTYDDDQAVEIGLARRNARDSQVLLEQAARRGDALRDRTVIDFEAS
ncbi:MAG: hypothetical protein GY719_21715 [bacterium]|nr:hypothetical protein [bacterium]